MENKTRTLRPVCLFAQHGGTGALPAHTRFFLRQIAQSGYRLHVALSGRDNDVSARDGLADLDVTFHPRLNLGLDFGAWQALLAAGCTGDASEILLTNDSVFGPFAPLPPLVDTMRARQYDIWGMVESQAITRHLQSWFVVLTPEALAHPALQRVFAQPFDAMTKEEIVLHGELGLGLAMAASGLRIGASWSGRRGLARLLAVNPMHTDWLTVLRSGRAPFIKTELLRDNPSGIWSAAYWRRSLPQGSPFDPSWIETYLACNPRRTATRHASLRARVIQALASEDRRAAFGALMRSGLLRNRRV